MHALRIEPLVIGHSKQRLQHVAADLGCAGLPGNAKAVAAACDLDVEATFDLPQVLVKLAAEIGQALVVGGLEHYVPRNLDSVQSTLEITVWRRRWEVHQAAAVRLARRPRREFGSASVMRTSTNWPMHEGSASKLTQRMFSVRPAT